jgi:hypothetical protein
VQCAGMWDTLPKIEMSDGTEMIPELLRHLDGSTVKGGAKPGHWGGVKVGQ